MAYLQGRFSIIEKREIAPGVWDYRICCPALTEQAQPGQFVQARVDGFFLRRPISICEANRETGLLRLVFEVRGEGTAQLSQLQSGESIDLIGPLGNGFLLPVPSEKLIVVGGGIGVPPMLWTAAEFGENATAILGFRTASAAMLQDDFAAHGCDLRLATDDGSAGFHGFVTALLQKRLAEGPAALICACGPMAMLKGVEALARENGIPCQVSLEERMACGVGACLVCACRTVRNGEEIYSHVCKDGPVFDGGKVVWQ